jgi:hypothetical protein
MSLESIQEGIDIYFDCHIDANPRPTTPIVWIFNGNVLHPQQGINKKIEIKREKKYKEFAEYNRHRFCIFV